MVSTRKATSACAQTNIRIRAPACAWGRVPVCKVTSAYVRVQTAMRRHVCMRDKDGQKTCTYARKGTPARKHRAVYARTHSCVHRRKYERARKHMSARAQRMCLAKFIHYMDANTCVRNKICSYVKQGHARARAPHADTYVCTPSHVCGEYY